MNRITVQYAVPNDPEIRQTLKEATADVPTDRGL
jgi:hypothetical protein